MDTRDKIIEKQDELIADLLRGYYLPTTLTFKKLQAEVASLKSEVPDKITDDRLTLMEQYHITKDDVDTAVRNYVNAHDNPITDEEIRVWIFKNDPIKDDDSEWDYGYRQGKFTGAKAMRDGLIK